MQMPLREAPTSSIQSSTFEKNKQNKHPRRKTKFLEKVGITTSSSCTTRPWETANKILFNHKANINRKRKEIEDLRNQIELLKQNQK